MTMDSFLNGDFMDESDDEGLDAGASLYSFLAPSILFISNFTDPE